MVFSSQVFIFFFLPLFLLCFYLAPRFLRVAVLTLFSYVFYGWWDWRFLFLIVFSTFVDYFCGLRIARTDSQSVRKKFVTLSIITNLLLLGFFKYFMFLSSAMNDIFTVAGMHYPQTLLDFKVILPVGISFYTFQSMSYTIDIYRQQAKPTKNFLDFACYISMFPQLVAGPIVRYSHIERQLRNPEYSLAQFYYGLQYFIVGLAKKVIIADSVSSISDMYFNAPSPLGYSTVDTLVAILAYTVQIYFDFSGYSDMAIGLGLFCGLSFPINFDSPYKAKSLSEFWRRWHITLSSWLRDYLYIPLGGSRRGKLLTYRNLAITMLLGGLWHGASWNFVIWGGFHGGMLAVERMLGERNPLRLLSDAGQQMVTFALVAFAWIFFRASDLSFSLQTIQRLGAFDFHRNLLLQNASSLHVAALVLGLFLIFCARNTSEWLPRALYVKTFFLAFLFIVSLSFLFGAVSHPFLYFQF